MVGAHCAISTRPISVEPVKVSMRTQRVGGQLLADHAGLAGDDVEHALGDAGPLGQHGQRERRQRRLGGRLHTTVQPTASAGATLRVIMAAGKFHGVMAATTPTGCLMTTMRASALKVGMVSP